MKKIGLNELRQLFQDFYKSKDHYARGSFSLVPEKDKSLLLINSGMAPLKPYFAGIETPPSKRMTTYQKCIRTGDIENVGLTARHGTFFEMLGSFSFGDYFKKESIAWGWEFITERLEMPVDKLWASIYEDDEEAYDLWKNMIGLDENKIVRLGKEDNFWEIGIGPCGPCSEIYFDRGEKFGCGSEDCKPGCECDRYIEFWNHVFTQYNRDEAGNYTPLPNPNIDTGMGLERLACIMQDVTSIFEVDTIKYILDSVIEVSGAKYTGTGTADDISIRIITDHIRSVTFLICDGVLPSNEGRGYVLRRLIRRAARHGRKIGIDKNFMADLAEKVIEVSKSAYPELVEKKESIQKILTVEEDRFNETIDQGNNILNEYMIELKASGSKILSGDKVFKLYDTYGFPIEHTEEILAEMDYEVDTEGFRDHMNRQKETARLARKESGDDEGWVADTAIYADMPQTDFIGYDCHSGDGKVIAILKNGEKVDAASQGDNIKIILSKTPFYAESGGQASDIGEISSSNCIIRVSKCEKVNGVFVHDCEVISGIIKTEELVQVAIDRLNRNSIARNHTATHMLHKALREVVGNHVTQAGSLVTSERLRFDFTHYEALSESELKQIEIIVNEKINSFLPVYTEEMDVDSATQKGAMALFSEKYTDLVRVVSVGGFSIELCGGTHISNSGQIGAFKIISEAGVAAGTRRIEAITGIELYNQIEKEETLLEEIYGILKANQNNIINKLASTIEDNAKIKRELDALKKESISGASDELISKAKEINGVKLITHRFDGADAGELRDTCDALKAEHQGLVMVFASVSDGKLMFIVSVSDDLLDKGYHAGNIIKQVAAVAGGGGGGKANMAQAGGKDISKADEALMKAEEIVGSV